MESLKDNTKDKYEEEYEESLNTLTSRLPELIDYLQVVNSNFMPQEFSFLDYVKGYNREDYILKLPPIANFDGDKDCYYKFIQSFINSEWPVLGDVNQNIISGESQFIYRKNYTYTPFFRPKNRKYQINLFSWPTKLEYLIEFLLNLDRLHNLDKLDESDKANELDKSDKVSSGYIYKNVFHTDIFIRRNYASRGQKTLKDNFTKALRSINDVLSGNDQFLDVTPLKTLIYNEKEGSFYDKLYEDEKFGEIFDVLIRENNKNDESESGNIVIFPKLNLKLKELLENPPSIPIDYRKLANNLNDKVKNAEMTSDEKAKYSKIIKKIEDRLVTEKDLLELAEIYNKYI